MNVETQSNGAVMITQERERQISEKGFNARRDDVYVDGQLAQAAIHYALQPDDSDVDGLVFWPADWDERWNQKADDDRVVQLAKAGALIAAEIDRLLRVPTAPTGDAPR